jgi:hypothetical protein
LVVLAALSPYASFGQATIDTQKKALDSIAEFAERMCTSIPFKGDSTTVELSGQAKAELSRLLKKIADAGLGGAVKYQSSEYEGVLQKDLASAIKSSQDCRISIFKELNISFFLQREPLPRSLRHIHDCRQLLVLLIGKSVLASRISQGCGEVRSRAALCCP